MKTTPFVIALVLAGIFTAGVAPAAPPAPDNTASKPKFDHKTLGPKDKDCVKCHKNLAPPKEAPPSQAPARPGR